MTEINNHLHFSDTDASITRLLSGLNFEDFQKQQDFLRSIKGNHETNTIVNGILELMDRVADVFENSTGHSLTNRFEALENFSKVLLLLEDATNKDYTLSELFMNENVAGVPSDDTFGYAHIRFGNIVCTIANYSIAYLLVRIGLIMPPISSFGLWFLPYPLPSLLIGGISAAIVCCLLIALDFVIWRPFFKAYERNILKEEEEAAAAQA